RKYAAERGIILVDTKLEMGKDLYFGDELLTPDSSRFWEQAAWIKAQKDGEVPQAFDKEFVRAWGKEIGIHERDPEKPEDVVWVQSRVVPEDILAMTTKLYRYIFWRLTGKKLEEFQIYRMGIHVKIPKVNVDVIIGSRTDLEQIRVGINYLKYAPNVCPGIGNIDFRVHVLSCHRNPDELRQYAKKAAVSGKVDVIIAGAGMAAQLSGMIKAYLAAEGSDIPVIGVGFAGSTAEADQAARLSIEQLPGQPVELDSKGRAYFGGEGFCQACEAAVRDEFLPKRNAIKPAEWNIQI
ncbi:AIR carboxylase family protein, partial [Candidatus Falkowbacteria bacterium]|nr:AIR carboxylase family protein [Candidatus Falkowbacteria bacterium]